MEWKYCMTHIVFSHSTAACFNYVLWGNMERDATYAITMGTGVLNYWSILLPINYFYLNLWISWWYYFILILTKSKNNKFQLNMLNNIYLK